MKDLLIFINKYYIILVLLFSIVYYKNFPIFPDEITINFLSTNASIFNNSAVYLINSCINFYEVSELILFFKNLITKIYVNIDSLIKFRYFSLSIGLSVFLYIWYFLFREKNNSIYYTFLLFWPLVFLPIFVLHRPELYFLLTISSILISFSGNESKSNGIHLLVCVVSYLVCLNMHPKALYLLPLLIFTLIKIVNKNFKYLVILVIIYISFEYFKFYQNIWMTCTHDYISNIVSSYQVNPLLLFTDPFNFLKSLLNSNTPIIIDRSISQLMIRNGYDIGFIPNIANKFWLWNLLNFLFIYIFISQFIIFYKSRKYIVIYLVLITILGIYLMNANKAPYDISLYFSILVLIFAHSNEKK
jgi:hypothetical protein